MSVQQILYSRLYGKRVFVFDWDGTILNSMPMKAQNFAQAFKSAIPENVAPWLLDDVVEHYLRLSGHPRKYIFHEVLKLLKFEASQISYDHFNSAFETLNRKNLVRADLFHDAIELLMTLVNSNRKIFISSSVPSRELIDLVDATLPSSIKHNISSILGSSDDFSKGKSHLQWIMNETGTTNDQLVVIGDDIADYDLSFGAGVDCILIDRKCALKGKHIEAVSDLYQVRDILKNEIQGTC